MNCCYLGLGSNQKCPERQLRQALENISKIPRTSIKKTSSFFWTKAWGLQVQQDFCNAVIEIQTNLQPLDLLNYCQKIERKQGRVRKKHWGPRTLDVDILLYEDRVISSLRLTLPHPHMYERDFVMKPLIEICNPKYLES